MRPERQKVAATKREAEMTTRIMWKLVVEEDEITQHRCRRLWRLRPSANIGLERWAVAARRCGPRGAYMEGRIWLTRKEEVTVQFDGEAECGEEGRAAKPEDDPVGIPA